MIETQFNIMEKRFDEMEKRFDAFEVKFDEFVKKLENIYFKMAGNELNPNGIVQELEHLKKEVEDLQKFKSRVIWTITLVAAVSTAIGAILTLGLQYLQIKK